MNNIRSMACIYSFRHAFVLDFISLDIHLFLYLFIIHFEDIKYIWFARRFIFKSNILGNIFVYYQILL